MREINAKKLIYSPGKSRYGVDCTLVVAHLRPVHVPDGTGISHIPVGHVATPWNRLTIPHRCAPCMDALVSQAQDVLERPLICTTTNAHSTPSNCRF